MNKGFTLVELMVVLVIIVIVSSIGYAGISAVQSGIKKNLWNGKIELIETGAKEYGEDNLNELNNICTIDEKEYDSCLETTVDYLIKNNYISTDETKEDGSKTITNDTLGEDDPNYYVNNLKVYIYVENNIVYAKLQTS